MSGGDEYQFDAILPQHYRDDAVGLASRMNLRRAITTAEQFRSKYPQHADSSMVLAARIIPDPNQPDENGSVHALYLITRPATMRRKAPKRRYSRLRRAWRCLRGR